MNKIKSIFIALLFLITSYNKSFGLEIERTIDITDKKIGIVGGFASNLLTIGEGKGKQFFKEQKSRNQKLDIDKLVNFYFKIMFNNTKNSEKDIILEKLSDPNNLNKFLNMGWMHWPDAPLFSFLNSQKYRGDIIGIPEPVPDKLKELLPGFLKYASREIMSIKVESGESKSKQNYPDGVLRSLATYKLAKLLGVPEIIVKTEYVAINQEGEETKIGILMENADGVTPHQFFSSNKKVLASFQRAMVNLYIFDAICMQNDRTINNYMCKIDESGNAVGVAAFDNDCSFPCNTNLTDSFFSLPPILTSDGKINFPYIDAEFVRNIMDIKFDVVSNELKNLITEDEIHALLTRIKSIQNAIKKTAKDNKNFLLEKDQWSNDTIKIELNEKYPSTYLKRFLKL